MSSCFLFLGSDVEAVAALLKRFLRLEEQHQLRQQQEEEEDEHSLNNSSDQDDEADEA